MNRVDELTLKLADEDLSEAEARELEQLLGNPAARAAHLALLDVVVRLRGARPAPELRDRTISLIQEKITGEIKKQVLGEIRRRGPARRAYVARPSRAWMGWLSLAAAAVVVVALAIVLRPTPPPPAPLEARGAEPEPVPPPPEPPKEEPRPRIEPPVPRVETPPPAPVLPAPKPEPERRKQPEAVERIEVAPREPVKPKPPAPPAADPPRSAVAVAQVVQTRGAVRPAKVATLLSGDGLSLESADALAVLQLPDGTRLTFRGPCSLRSISEGEAGKRVDLAEGYLLAEVARQPDARPFTVATPHVEARVLGTTLKVLADPDAKVGTRVEVLEGKVRLKRADGRTLDLGAGQQSQAVAGQALAARPRVGLVGHWKLDETAGLAAADASGELHPGKLQGAASWSAGRLGGGVRVGGGGSVTVPGFKLPERFTVAFWVFQRTLNAEQDWFLNFGSNEFFLMREGNMERRQVRTGFERPTQEFLTVASAVTANQWTHLAATFDGAELRLFENGTAAGTRKIAVNHPISPGASFARMAASSEGVIDDVRVYDRVLPLQEIRLVLAGARR